MIMITKWHFLRLFLCGLFTWMMIILSMGMNSIFAYIFLRWQLDIQQFNLEGNPVEALYIAMFWNIFVAVVIIAMAWYFIGLPRKIKFFEKTEIQGG
jgi:hypothetical protein